MIQRQFVRIGNRHVHFRSAGHGPPLLLLHQSPQNSRMWLDMIVRFADRYTVIAPDTPGFGYSDPLLTENPGIADFADATFEFSDALGLDRFALFGMHTGGLIGMHAAWSRPERLSCLIVDGYALFNNEERSSYTESYLPRFEPTWDGAHLRWLWSRMREQVYFFPWCDPSAKCAIALEPYTPAQTHVAAMDILDVGDNYRIGYGAAFRYVERERVAEIQCPSWLIYRTTDVLLAHRQRLPPLPPNVVSEVEADDLVGLHQRMDTILAQTSTELGDVALPASTTPLPGWSRRIVVTPVGEIAAWVHPGVGEAVLHIHPPGERPLQPDQIQADQRCHITIELPGHGASSEIDAVPNALTMHSALSAMIQALAGTLPISIEAHEGAAAYVPALAEVLGQRLRSLVLHRPWLLNEEECACFLQQLPAPAIQRGGGHLGDAWQWERERHLMWPWLPPSSRSRRLVAAPAPQWLHDNVVELLRLGDQLHPLFADVAVPGLADTLAQLNLPTLIINTAQDDYDGRASALQARIQGHQ